MTAVVRSEVVAAIIRGDDVAPAVVAGFPDIVQVADPSTVPDWFMSLLRRPVAPTGPRYVIADGQPFHVAPTGGGPLVSRVEHFDQHGVRKPVLNPYAVTAEGRQAALNAFQRVQQFVQDPSQFRDWLAAGLTGDAPVLSVTVSASPVAAQLARDYVAPPPPQPQPSTETGVGVVIKRVTRRRIGA